MMTYRENVSIPYRYSNNEQRAWYLGETEEVSIPYRYSNNCGQMIQEEIWLESFNSL